LVPHADAPSSCLSRSDQQPTSSRLTNGSTETHTVFETSNQIIIGYRSKYISDIYNGQIY
jgi:hypothetical protein